MVYSKQQLLPDIVRGSSASSYQYADGVGSLLHQHPLTANMEYSYGTAGFRYDASLLDGVMVRVGIVAALLGGQIGVMITASHNDEVCSLHVILLSCCLRLMPELLRF